MRPPLSNAVTNLTWFKLVEARRIGVYKLPCWIDYSKMKLLALLIFGLSLINGEVIRLRRQYAPKAGFNEVNWG